MKNGGRSSWGLLRLQTLSQNVYKFPLPHFTDALNFVLPWLASYVFNVQDVAGFVNSGSFLPTSVNRVKKI